MNYRILIVEDETLIADGIERALLRAGHTVVGQAPDYATAVRLIDREAPELVLLDINLVGDRTGLDVADYLRATAPEAAFIFLTAKTGPRYIDRAKALLPAGYLAKPFQPSSIVATIEVAMFGRQRSAPAVEPTILLRSGGEVVRQEVADIACILSDHVYLRIVRRDGSSFLHRGALRALVDQLPAADFIQTHRGAVVNRSTIDRWDRNWVYVGDERVPISRKRRPEVTDWLEHPNR